MNPEIDHILLVPDGIGWTLKIKTEVGYYEFGVGDANQFHAETERTIGRWLANGPADFHNAPDPVDDAAIAETVRARDETDTGERLSFDDLIDDLDNPDLARDIERGK